MELKPTWCRITLSYLQQICKFSSQLDDLFGINCCRYSAYIYVYQSKRVLNLEKWIIEYNQIDTKMLDVLKSENNVK